MINYLSKNELAPYKKVLTDLSYINKKTSTDELKRKFEKSIEFIPNEIKSRLKSQKESRMGEISSYYFELNSKLVRPRFILILSLIIIELKKKKEFEKSKNNYEEYCKVLEKEFGSKEFMDCVKWSSVIEMIHTSSLYHVI